MRLTSSTVCQSSSLSRSARLSRVSPALLTRMSRPPPLSTASTRRSAAPGSASSAGSTRPPARPARPPAPRAPRAGGRSAPRARPGRAAAARSRRRCRPRRRSPARSGRTDRTCAMPARGGAARADATRRRRRRSPRACRARRSRRPRAVRLARPAEHPAGAELDDRLDAAPGHGQQALAPAHPGRHLPRPAGSRSVAGSRSGAAVTLAISGTAGAPQRDPGQRRPARLGGRRHQRQWNGALTGSIMLRRAPLALASSTARSTAARAPLTTAWPGALSLATSQTPLRGGLGRDRLDRRRARGRGSRPSRPRRPAPPPASPGRAAAAGARHRRSQRLPAAASAEYSPSEWPATQPAELGEPCGRSRASSARSAASEVAISAGWAFSVRRSRSSGPSKISRLSGSPSASSTSSNTARPPAPRRTGPGPCRPPASPGPGRSMLRACDPAQIAVRRFLAPAPGLSRRRSPADGPRWNLALAGTAFFV